MQQQGQVYNPNVAAPQPNVAAPAAHQPNIPGVPVGTPAVPQQNTGAGNLKTIGILSHAGTSLFEAITYNDVSSNFPKTIAILMFVPGRPDNSKQSGRTYNMDEKKYIKFSISELFQLSYALEEAAATGFSDFMKFADSSKFNNAAEKVVKKVNVSAMQGDRGLKIFMTYEGNGQKITITMTKYDAIGLSKRLLALANKAEIFMQTSKANNMPNHV